MIDLLGFVKQVQNYPQGFVADCASVVVKRN